MLIEAKIKFLLLQESQKIFQEPPQEWSASSSLHFSLLQSSVDNTKIAMGYGIYRVQNIQVKNN